ncbi:flagellar basal-body rod protein FlgG [Desulfurobacterium atlanticum]|uniref:Flagellar basal-body rod protein FlgG n=1 Tax=Desulfurobacterium atlanticum TaxID=240169 RepID=A0A238ZZ49_9BACT|nr:flagellar basal-body rod protein FlgG [Desulfurobacterium atlanticum]SNR88590.1 flagellar basal-body rod protein FlgG [Desulfurobacterium atlanticum]
MIRALWTSASGMEAQQTNLDVISNNIANVNTVGFKRSRANFEDLIYQTIRDPGTMSSDETMIPSGIQIGLGVKLSDTSKIFTQGSLIKTDKQFDIAIQGGGFFKIELPGGGEAYTRAGNFQVDSEGYLVTPEGYRLSPNIQISSPETVINVSISPGGSVYVIRNSGGQQTVEEVGKIKLYKFINPAGLKSLGGNLYAVTDASGEPVEGDPNTDGFGRLAQGFLEASNVNIVEEMVNLIVAQRAYEINSKGITTADEMLRVVSGLKA